MGTMRERSAGVWELIVSTARDPATGKYARVIRSVNASGKREAKAALVALESEVQKGLITSNDPTVAELLERWMEHIASRGRSDATLYNYG